MTPIKREHTTRTLRAPSNWDAEKDGPCEGLPITDFEGAMYSYWKPTCKQRLLILFGRTVRLGIMSEGHPPVSMDLEAD